MRIHTSLGGASFLLVLAASAGDLRSEPRTPDENALRRAFAREIRSRTPAKRVEAVNKLKGCEEEKTVEVLAKVLKDPAQEVRKAVAEAIAASTDGAGRAIKPLCAVLTNKKEDPEVRLACAQALGKAKYRAEALAALVETISGIDKTERHLFKFGADCTAVLNTVGGQDFGAGKDTPKKWQDWLKKNRAEILREDKAKLAEYKRAARSRKK